MAQKTPAPRRLFSSIGKVLLVGLLIREGFSFWTGHPYDFEIWVRVGHAVANGQNPYAQLPYVPGASFTYPGATLPGAAYLPFWPLLLGGIYRLWEAVGFGNRFVLYFLLKQPGILSDVLGAYLLYYLVDRWTGLRDRALAVATFWSLFPYAILITSIWGMFDSIVVVLLLASFLTLDPVRRNLLWGIGIFVKWVTVVFVPFELFRARGFRRLAFLVGLAIPVGLTGLLFLGVSWSTGGITSGSVYQSHGNGFGMNIAGILSVPPLYGWLDPIPYLYAALGYLWIPAAILTGWIAARWLLPASPGAELRAALLIVATFLAVRWGLNEQYMLYIFALLAADIAAFHPERKNLFLLLVGLSFAYLLGNNDLGMRFISPIDPGIWPYAEQLDASAGYGMVRYYALLAISVLIAVTLAQLVYVILRDDPRPRPWLLPFLRGRPRPAPPNPEAGPP